MFVVVVEYEIFDPVGPRGEEFGVDDVTEL